MKRIPPFKLIPEPLSDDARALLPFKWAGTEAGHRHQLGGTPDFVADFDWPRCDECNEEMAFYGQLDSINDEFCIGDAGLIQVFVCFECVQVKARVESA
jgi:hypothetical protein